MLEITDLSKIDHLINLANLNHVVFRKAGESHVISFHMRDQHVMPVTVDEQTVLHIKSEMKKWAQ